MQFLKELRPSCGSMGWTSWTYLNEVQFPKELRRGVITSRVRRWTDLNEVQFPKELRQVGALALAWLTRPQ